MIEKYKGFTIKITKDDFANNPRTQHDKDIKKKVYNYLINFVKKQYLIENSRTPI